MPKFAMMKRYTCSQWSSPRSPAGHPPLGTPHAFWIRLTAKRPKGSLTDDTTGQQNEEGSHLLEATQISALPEMQSLYVV